MFIQSSLTGHVIVRTNATRASATIVARFIYFYQKLLEVNHYIFCQNFHIMLELEMNSKRLVISD